MEIVRVNALRSLDEEDGLENRDVVENILIVLFFLASAVLGYMLANCLGL
ncbi:MAG: hypothetical protein QXM37_02585 [Candidatus Bathyarchaeia archaeon]